MNPLWNGRKPDRSNVEARASFQITYQLSNVLEEGIIT